MSGQTILVVEDNADLAFAVTTALLFGLVPAQDRLGLPRVH